MASLPKRICRAVKRHPVLYDHAAGVEAGREEVDESWEAVAYECNETVSAIKLQWNDMKKTFIRNLEKPQKNQTRKTRSRDSYLHEELKFLLPHIKDESMNSADDFNDSDASIAKSTNTPISSPSVSTPTQSSTSKAAASTATSTNIQKSTSNNNLNSSGNFSLSNLMISTKDGMIGVYNDKRKRELSKSLMNSQTLAIMNEHDGKQRQSNVATYIITEPPTDNSSAIRFRRIVEDPAERKEKEKARKAAAIASAAATAAATAAAAKNQEIASIDEKSQENSNENKLLRTRSRSLCVERAIEGDNENDDDNDNEHKPPPAKKLALDSSESKETITQRKTRVKTRVLAGNSTVGKNVVEAIVSSSTPGRLPASPIKTKTPKSTTMPMNSTTKSIQLTDPLEIYDSPKPSYVKSKNAKNVINPIELSSDTEAIGGGDGGQVDNYDFGIDMNLLAAAAAAEAAAAKEEKMSTFRIDNSTQCQYQTDEEDNEFIERMRKWMQNMNSRQKIIFRKGVLQAYLEVFDDPRHFDMPKGYDKCLTSQQNSLPSIFHGMSPVELRLVRHLAITVAGHKMTQDTKCVSPSSFKLMSGCNNNNSTQNDEHPPLATTPPALVAQHALLRCQLPIPEKPPSVIRTTAIALSNHARTASGMQRVLRKVVRVNNGTGDNSTVRQSNGTVLCNSGSGSVSIGGSGSNSSSPGLLRARSAVNPNNSGSLSTSKADKQRIYRILPNGSIKCHVSGAPSPRLNNNSNSGNNSPSNGQFLLPNCPTNTSSSSSSAPTTATTTLSTNNNNRSPSNGGGSNSGNSTSTMTTSTGTVIPTRNVNAKSNSGITQTLIDPKTGICIRRHLSGSNNSGVTALPTTRATISRRYSICSSAPPRELQQSSPIAEPTSAQLWQSLDEPNSIATTTSATKHAKLPTLNNRNKINEQQQQQETSPLLPTAPPKPTVRVRFAQNHGTPVTATNSARVSNSDNQFLLPSPRKQAPQWKEPSPVNTNLLKNQLLQQQIQQKQQQLQHLLKSTSDEESFLNTNSPGDESEFIQDHSNGNKSNCLITSDDFQNFVVKNEPLDIEPDEEE